MSSFRSRYWYMVATGISAAAAISRIVAFANPLVAITLDAPSTMRRQRSSTTSREKLCATVPFPTLIRASRFAGSAVRSSSIDIWVCVTSAICSSSRNTTARQVEMQRPTWIGRASALSVLPRPLHEIGLGLDGGALVFGWQVQHRAVGVGAVGKRHDHAAAHGPAGGEVLGLDLEPRDHPMRRRERKGDAQHLSQPRLVQVEELNGVQGTFQSAE